MAKRGRKPGISPKKKLVKPEKKTRATSRLVIATEVEDDDELQDQPFKIIDIPVKVARKYKEVMKREKRVMLTLAQIKEGQAFLMPRHSKGWLVNWLKTNHPNKVFKCTTLPVKKDEEPMIQVTYLNNGVKTSKQR